MIIDVDTLSIVLSESFGIVFFFLALVFFLQSRKITDKQERLKKAATDEIWNGPCYSIKWVMSHSVKRKKLFATPALVAFIGILGAFLVYGPPTQIIFYVFIVFGYFSIIAVIGVAILLLETNAYQAYSYGRAIQKVGPDQLSREDQSYMELAKEALENATVRFLIIGILYAVVGPFTPQIFDGLTYTLATYARILLHATEASFEISPVLAFPIALILMGILFYLPELMGRIIFRRVKLLAQRIWERWRKR